ncbi:hypothetical protein ACRE_090910 [Hapsidospora chrysogenum ATCC 11550]|uniref:Uncharacterized protein n=1 Tax=Hapsidospora chrysogenum (strain ATCC 11550 / CBS 779.69 / DSM 880 / IAM 14645 / JCM 23072 / IMI 49137) TaxID=857340 RepID=A0A086ST16_HAPC1|nr:hypothetical protein ACRE_090910 [Hapsidospora chrysogenum ATCC 11550]
MAGKGVSTKVRCSNQQGGGCWVLLASRFSSGTPSSTEQGHRSTGEAPVPQEQSMARREQ